MGKNSKLHIYQQNNRKCTYYELNMKKSFGAFDIGETTNLKEFNPDELLFDACKTGEKILNNLKDLIKEKEINGDIIEQIENLDLSELLEQNIAPITEWCEKYGFPSSLSDDLIKETKINNDTIEQVENLDLSESLEQDIASITECNEKYEFPSSLLEYIIPGAKIYCDTIERNYIPIISDDILTFSKNLMIFYLFYSFHLNLVFLYNDKLDYYKRKDIFDYEDYINNKIKVKINNINVLGPLIIKNFKLMKVNDFTNLQNKEKRKLFIEQFKIPYLEAVNDFSYNLKNTIISIINIEEKSVDISSENIMHSIWHTFINYIILDTKPSKICECKICGKELIQTGSKKPTRCSEHINNDRQKEKDLKKERRIKVLLSYIRSYKIKDTNIVNIQAELKKVLQKRNFRSLTMKTLDNYKITLCNYIRTNNLTKK